MCPRKPQEIQLTRQWRGGRHINDSYFLSVGKKKIKILKSSPISLSWMSGLKMEQGCFVVMDESCNGSQNKSSCIYGYFAQRNPV